MLLAVSGGLDSIVLFNLFKRAEISFGVSHCNFQLRDKESDGDEQFVKELCERNSLPFFSIRFETKEYAQANGVSIQMAARELRYAWFEELLEKEKYNALATAHHLNDSVETVLMNWIHGQSVDGFTGIPVKNGKIIRPLLFATREAIENYALENQLLWREDSSNITTDYQRNFIRHEIIPKLKEINPSLEATVSRGMSKLAGEISLLDTAFDDWKKGFVKQSQEKSIIDKSAFGNPITGASLLWRLTRHLGFDYDVCVSVMEALDGQPGKKFIGPAHTLVVDRDHLILFAKVDFWKETLIQRDLQKVFLGSWSLELSESSVRKSDVQQEAVLDADKIKFPLCWRQWRPGDVFYPLGMNHRKKVSDLLIDEKVSVADKAIVTVLESEGEIIWVVGHRIDNRFKITEETQRALSFRVSPYFI